MQIKTTKCEIKDINQETGTIEAQFFYSDDTTFSVSYEDIPLESNQTIVDGLRSKVAGAHQEEKDTVILFNNEIIS